MPNLNFHKIKKIGIGRGLTKIKYGYIWKDAQFKRVWSGASEVSYYDGNNLLGVEEVEDGADALHPSVSTTKTGYTLYGWSNKPNPKPSDRVTEYLADGDPKSLYAIYVPNTLIVVKASVWTDAAGNPNYQLEIQNGDYVNGNTVMNASKWYSTGPFEGSTVFTFNKGVYQTVNATLWSGVRDYGETYIDGIRKRAGDDVHGYDSVQLTNGEHTLRCYGWAHHNDSWAICLIGVTNITLSNPEAWV